MHPSVESGIVSLIWVYHGIMCRIGHPSMVTYTNICVIATYHQSHAIPHGTRVACLASISSTGPIQDMFSRCCPHRHPSIVLARLMAMIPSTAINALNFPFIARAAWWSFSGAGRPADEKALSNRLLFTCTQHGSIISSRSLDCGNSCPFHLLRAP